MRLLLLVAALTVFAAGPATAQTGGPLADWSSPLREP